MNNKISIYLVDDVLNEVRSEARRLDRSISWMLAQAWLASRERFKRMPSLPPAHEECLR
jgi:uncharacterized small protein (TIGR04563 family)